MKPGSVILVSSTGWLSTLIKLFGRSKWSHTALKAGTYDCVSFGMPLVFEAKMLVKLTVLNYDIPGDFHKAYEWVGPDLQRIAGEETERIVLEFDGKDYGYASLLWFVWRWLVEVLHLPRRWAVHNFLPGGRVCTEVVHVVMGRVGERERVQLGRDTVIGAMAVDGYDSEAVRPSDIEQICIRLTEVGTMRSI